LKIFPPCFSYCWQSRSIFFFFFPKGFCVPDKFFCRLFPSCFPDFPYFPGELAAPFKDGFAFFFSPKVAGFFPRFPNRPHTSLSPFFQQAIRSFFVCYWSFFFGCERRIPPPPLFFIPCTLSHLLAVFDWGEVFSNACAAIFGPEGDDAFFWNSSTH